MTKCYTKDIHELEAAVIGFKGSSRGFRKVKSTPAKVREIGKTSVDENNTKTKPFGQKIFFFASKKLENYTDYSMLFPPSPELPQEDLLMLINLGSSYYYKKTSICYERNKTRSQVEYLKDSRAWDDITSNELGIIKLQNLLKAHFESENLKIDAKYKNLQGTLDQVSTEFNFVPDLNGSSRKRKLSPSYTSSETTKRSNSPKDLIPINFAKNLNFISVKSSFEKYQKENKLLKLLYLSLYKQENSRRSVDYLETLGLSNFISREYSIADKNKYDCIEVLTRLIKILKENNARTLIYTKNKEELKFVSDLVDGLKNQDGERIRYVPISSSAEAMGLTMALTSQTDLGANLALDSMPDLVHVNGEKSLKEFLNYQKTHSLEQYGAIIGFDIDISKNKIVDLGIEIKKPSFSHKSHHHGFIINLSSRDRIY